MSKFDIEYEKVKIHLKEYYAWGKSSFNNSLNQRTVGYSYENNIFNKDKQFMSIVNDKRLTLNWTKIVKKHNINN